MKFGWHGVCAIAVVLAVGCGGGGGGNGGGGGSTDQYARPKVTIAWGPRSKAVSGPSSALSAVIELKNASRTGGDVSYSVDRSGPAEGSSVVYTGAQDVKVSNTTMIVRFYSATAGGGTLVGTASGLVPVAADGTITTSIATDGIIKSVEVPAGQILTVDEKRALNFGAYDADHDLVAVTPASATWNVVNGADKLTFAEGEAKGVATGEAEVTATVDGKTSAAATVKVNSPGDITVAVSPTSLSVAPLATQQFTATVQGTANPAVTWSIVENGGGTITASGLYTAPPASGTFTIKATSVVNPAKFATATVQVENVQVTIAPITKTVAKGGTIQFTADVTGTANKNVTWSVIETAGGTISGAGLYTAPNTLGNYTVRVTSAANTAVFAEATVSVEAGEFTVLGRIDAAEGGLEAVRYPVALSGDGSTVTGALGGALSSKAAYWTHQTGWVGLTMPAPVVTSTAGAVSEDGSYIVLSGSNAAHTRNPVYRYHRVGPMERIYADHVDNPDPIGVAITDDGSSVFTLVGTFSSTARWVPSGTNTSSILVNYFEVQAITADGGTIAGRMQPNPQNAEGTRLWSNGNFETLPFGGNIRGMSAHGNAIITDEIYWTRSGGQKKLLEEGANVALSRDGKYVVCRDAEQFYIWSEEKGLMPLTPLLEAAGAPAGMKFRASLIASDGRTLAGYFVKPLGGDQTAEYAYHCRLPAPP